MSVKRSIRVSSFVDNKILDISKKNNWSYSKVVNVILESFCL